MTFSPFVNLVISSHGHGGVVCPWAATLKRRPVSDCAPFSSIKTSCATTHVAQSRKRRIAIFIEPSPFTYVCGFRNRFCNTIRELVAAGCEVLVITTGRGLTLPGTPSDAFREQPVEYEGAKVLGVFSIACPFYWSMPLGLALTPKVFRELRSFNPDLLHCSSPGLMTFAASVHARLLKRPLVMSYHTHVPAYLPKYGLGFLVGAMWLLIRLMQHAAHLVLTTSPALKVEVSKHCNMAPDSVQVWRKAVDTDIFHPRHHCAAMRCRMSGQAAAGNGVHNHAEGPLMVYVGRLGSEKNLQFLRKVLEQLPTARLAFVGDGPSRADLQQVFKDTNTIFLGMLHGEELSQAYASADVFVMPSESETLGFVVLEAMASGVPVVAVSAGGIPNIIDKPGVTGLLYSPGHVAQAVAHIQALWDDSDLRQSIVQAARKEVELWDWKSATRHLLETQYALAVAAAAASYGQLLQEVTALWPQMRLACDSRRDDITGWDSPGQFAEVQELVEVLPG